jgi:hypothetical protein
MLLQSSFPDGGAVASSAQSSCVVVMAAAARLPLRFSAASTQPTKHYPLQCVSGLLVIF